MPKPPPFTPTPEDISRAIYPGVYYEIEHFFNAFREMPEDQGTIRNAMLESMLLRARSLRSFFETGLPDRNGKPTHRRKQDVLASDFGFSPSSAEILPEDLERMDEDLAHLTYASVNRDRAQKKWDLKNMIPLVRRCLEFARHVTTGPFIGDSAEGEIAWHGLRRQLEVCLPGTDVPQCPPGCAEREARPGTA